MNERNPYAPPRSEVRDLKASSEPDDLASRGARLGAVLLDGIVTLIMILPLLFVTGYWDSALAGTVSLPMTFGLAITNFVLFCAVNGYLLATAGQTVGKRLVGMRIVGAADGRLPTLATLLGLRYGLMYLFNAIPGIGNVFALVDGLFVFRADRRCVHDLIAGTKVIKARARDRRD